MNTNQTSEPNMVGVNPAADPAWVAERDRAGAMSAAEADVFYTALENQRAQSPDIDDIKVDARVTTPAGTGTIVEWNPVGGEGEVQIDGQSREFLYPLDAADVLSGRTILHNA